MSEGKVYLIGAGPGDPELITVKGIRCIGESDVIVYDNLANSKLLEYCKQSAEKVYMGKRKGAHSFTQDEINEYLVKRAKEGLIIGRLKGGDPFMFGRGGEEVLYLVENDIPFEIVPGITSALAAPIYAGIPPTHRDFASSLAIITGHESPLKDETAIKWDKISTGADTLIFLMGMTKLSEIVDNLINNGRPIDTPCALIRNGTYPEQKTLIGTLGNIVELSINENFKPPVVIIVGQVVGLRDKMNWFESKPLFGKRIVVTRARSQASSFFLELEKLGASVLEYPTIKIISPESWVEVDKALQNLGDYQWVIFTSVNGVTFFFDRLKEIGKDSRSLHQAKICAIGPATAEILKRFNLEVDIRPDEYRAEGIIEALVSEEVKGKKILIPRAKEAREILPEELSRLGARVDVIPIYRTVKDDTDVNLIISEIEGGLLDVITFTSSSTVVNFFESFDGVGIPKGLEDVVIACIGPITRDKVEKYGFQVSIMPEKYTIPALCDEISNFFSEKKRNSCK
ncbi:uroporphyrinogen-III C-methyltransferase [bacterium]|nr:uroporphyrinogen-III C-methyltransferase [bacterium]